MMDNKTKGKIFSCVDHTLLSVTATAEDIRKTVREGIKYGCASVCIPPRFVGVAREEAKGRIAVCTVVGFPNGYSTAAVKAFEAKEAIENGAAEIDTVIPVGALRGGDIDALKEELMLLREATRGYILKVIIETSLLTEEEKRVAARIVSESGADFIKTSTGFSTGGATHEDVVLLKESVAEGVRVKAAGGISDFADAERYLSEGADRLGTSRLVKISEQEDAKGY